MKTYRGERTLRGSVVTVDGVPLPLRGDLRQFSRTGFEWGFEGPGPRQLALALLADHFGDDRKALELSDAFMHQVTAQLDNLWQIDSAELDKCLAELPSASSA